MHKIEAHNNEKSEIIKTLREKVNVTCTPVGKKHGQTHHEKSTVADANDKLVCLKRGTIHSPTPRKLKMVKHGSPLLKTQASQSHREEIFSNQQNLEIRKSARIKLFTPSKIKVVYRANKETETIKSRIISGYFAKVVKGITKGNSRKSLAKTLFSSNLHPHLPACFIKKIKQELSDLLSTKNVSILKQANCENLTNFG